MSWRESVNEGHDAGRPLLALHLVGRAAQDAGTSAGTCVQSGGLPVTSIRFSAVEQVERVDHTDDLPGHCSHTKSQLAVTLAFSTDFGGPMHPHFMDAKQTAEYLNMSVTWVYRDAPRQGLAAYRFGAGRNAKLQFKVADVDAWARQQRLM